MALSPYARIAMLMIVFAQMEATGQSPSTHFRGVARELEINERHASVLVGGTRLTAGMAEDKTIAALAAAFDVERDRTGWFVRTKDQKPVRLVAQVAFRNGRLSHVRKYWSPYDQQNAAPMASALYGALNQLTREGHRVCGISTHTTQSAGGEEKSAVLDCSGKRLELFVLRHGRDESALLDEVLD